MAPRTAPAADPGHEQSSHQCGQIHVGPVTSSPSGRALKRSAGVISVPDHAAGITPDRVTRIFHMFSRMDSDLAGAEGGPGLGLALANGLGELHGERIEARSPGLGHGSEFIVTLPASLIVNASDQVQSIRRTRARRCQSVYCRRMTIATAPGRREYFWKRSATKCRLPIGPRAGRRRGSTIRVYK